MQIGTVTTTQWRVQVTSKQK